MPAAGGSAITKSSGTTIACRARTFKNGSHSDARMRGMMYSTKTALVIRVDLPLWQVANVAAFLSGGLAGAYPEIVGEPYRDGRPALHADDPRADFRLRRHERRTHPHPRPLGQPRHPLRCSRRPTMPTTAPASLRRQPPRSILSGLDSTPTERLSTRSPPG